MAKMSLLCTCKSRSAKQEKENLGTSNNTRPILPPSPPPWSLVNRNGPHTFFSSPSSLPRAKLHMIHNTQQPTPDSSTPSSLFMLRRDRTMAEAVESVYRQSIFAPISCNPRPLEIRNRTPKYPERSSPLVQKQRRIVPADKQHSRQSREWDTPPPGEDEAHTDVPSSRKRALLDTVEIMSAKRVRRQPSCIHNFPFVDSKFISDSASSGSDTESVTSSFTVHSTLHTRTPEDIYDVLLIVGERMSTTSLTSHAYLVRWTEYPDTNWILAKDCFCPGLIANAHAMQREEIEAATRIGHWAKVGRLRTMEIARDTRRRKEMKRVQRLRRDDRGQFRKKRAGTMAREKAEDLEEDGESYLPRNARSNTARFTSGLSLDRETDGGKGMIIWLREGVTDPDDLGSSGDAAVVAEWLDVDEAVQEAEVVDVEDWRANVELEEGEMRRRQDEDAIAVAAAEARQEEYILELAERLTIEEEERIQLLDKERDRLAREDAMRRNEKWRAAKAEEKARRLLESETEDAGDCGWEAMDVEPLATCARMRNGTVLKDEGLVEQQRREKSCKRKVGVMMYQAQVDKGPLPPARNPHAGSGVRIGWTESEGEKKLKELRELEARNHTGRKLVRSEFDAELSAKRWKLLIGQTDGPVMDGRRKSKREGCDVLKMTTEV